MPFFNSPTAFHQLNPTPPYSDFGNLDTIGFTPQQSYSPHSMSMMKGGGVLPPHSSHPAFGRLTLLVFEAVLEVVCVSLPGYIVARQGMFNAEMQKFAANLNVMLFTPCLIFTKLASQLTADKLADLAVIPVIFLVQTLVSYLCSIAVSRAFGFKKRPRNFVVAMGVFGNSNSLPISLVLSLSQTIKGLHWDRIPGDNDDDVAARGILYLLIFQQLGQLVRWSWGYNVLLAPPEILEEEEATDSRLERGQIRYSDDRGEESERLVDDSDYDAERDSHSMNNGSTLINTEDDRAGNGGTGSSNSNQDSGSGEQTPVTHRQYTSSVVSNASSIGEPLKFRPAPGLLPTPTNGNILPMEQHDYSNRATTTSATSQSDEHAPKGAWGGMTQCKHFVNARLRTVYTAVSATSDSVFQSLPRPLQTGLSRIYAIVAKFLFGVWSFMNPPLWAMLAAIVVASIPALQSLFFRDGTFVKNSITSAIRQSGGVAVPLILVVLGANLARNTLPKDTDGTKEAHQEETKLLIAALVSRMFLPLAVMTPILTLTAKFVPISILDDPIFVIVCFLLTGAPSALQLAQICQINNVYMGTITRLLFQSYVVWILPSTLICVMLALEVVEWAAA